MKNLFIIAVLVLMGYSFLQAATLTVPSPYATIQAAVAAAGDGDVIQITNGTYTLTTTLYLNHELTIIGESEAGVIINATAVGGWAINPNKSNTSLSYMTIIPNGTTGGYPIHVGDNIGPAVISNVSLSHMTINGAKKTAFDFNGVTNLSLSYLTATNTTGGNGVQVSGCTNVTVNNITTSGNAWGGFAIYVGNLPPSSVGRGSDNVNIDGTTCSFAENTKIYNQDENGFFNTNITIAGFDYLVKNTSKVGYDFYQIDRTTALAYAGALTPPSNSSVKQISNGQYWVSSGLTIQAAIVAASAGDIINVEAGTYTEIGQIVINKNLSIIGADKNTTIIKPNQNTDNSGDAKGWFLVNAGVTFNLSNVTLDGTGYKIFQAIRDLGKGTINNCIFNQIKYNESGGDYAGCVIAAFGEPSMNVDVTNCSFSEIGREGVLFYGAGITGSSFSGNTYTGKGTGDWLDYAVEAGAGANVTISNNTISGNKGVASFDGSTSAGILITTLYGSGTQSTITGNTITNNTNGIAVGYDAYDASVVVARNNDLSSNSYGVFSTQSLVDAKYNWWGSVSGPTYPTNIGGNGVNVSDYVLFNPWNNNALLPVELSSFTSIINGRNVQLNWETKTEKNSDKFVIEKMNSSVGSSWVNVGSVKAAVLSNSPKQYSFTDKNLQAGKYQYRLKMIDNDGSFEYSKIVETEVASPKIFELSQNYPNPFNPSTRIDYQVPVDAKVIMEVYNIAGQKVSELVNQEQSAGYYTVDFGASKLSSGVYIYRIVASDKATGNNFSLIKKMMLLK